MMETCPNDPKRGLPPPPATALPGAGSAPLCAAEGRAGRPPPRKRPRRAAMITAEQHNLHEEPNRFIGRERELGELRASLLSSRALTLCGTGGIGKTRLAGRI